MCVPAIFLETALVLIAVGVCGHPLAVHFAFMPIPNVCVPANPAVLPRPVTLVVLETANIRITVGENVLPGAML